MLIDWEKRYGFSRFPTAERWAQVTENGKAHLTLARVLRGSAYLSL